MYLSLTVNCSLGDEGLETGNTPKTPEIINSIVNMNAPPLMDPYKRDPQFSDVNHRVVSGMDVSSPGNSPPMIPAEGCPALPSIQENRMKLIKEDLKYKIKSRNHSLSSSDFDTDPKTEFDEQPTEEDREKRQRRRERNKVAATKCRNKKKEMYSELIHDEKVLESENMRLRQDKERYEREFEELRKILRAHKAETSCSIGGAYSETNIMDMHQVINVPSRGGLPNSSPASLGSPYSVCATPSPQSTQHPHYYTDSSPYQMGLSPTLPEAPPHPSIEHATTSQVISPFHHEPCHPSDLQPHEHLQHHTDLQCHPTTDLQAGHCHHTDLHAAGQCHPPQDLQAGQPGMPLTNPYNQLQSDSGYSATHQNPLYVNTQYAVESGDEMFLNTINCF